jgi:hypothetical protein
LAHAYTPGLRVSPLTILRKERTLPLKGQVVVKVGDVVAADRVVARTELPGNVHSVNVANILSVLPDEVPSKMERKEGDPVKAGDILARSSTLFGLFKSTVKSPITGTVESVSHVTGQVLLREPSIPVEVDAYVDGKVVEVREAEGVVVETHGAFIQGIFGIGGETFGRTAACGKDPRRRVHGHRGGAQQGGRLGCEGNRLRRNRRFDDQGILGIRDRRRDHRQRRKGPHGRDHGRVKKASMNGATQIRAGVIRPEVVVPLLDRVATGGPVAAVVAGGLDTGTKVRIIREPHFGKLGRVVDLPAPLEKLPSEAHVRVLHVELEGTKQRHMLPRANVEIIET